MDQQRMHDIMSGRLGGVGPGVLRVVLAAASLPYATVMRLRRWAYRRGILRSHAADAAVICVGNLTTGGTGKTPMVVWIVRQLAEAGRKVAILTRGYKAVEGTSDEAELLKSLCNAAVVINPDRVAGAASAAADGADVLVMDDGYQHRRLRRDLDIVLVSAANPFGYNWCLPRGLLREPPSALRDADVIVITHSDEVPPERLAELKQRLGRLACGATIGLANHRPTHLIADRGEIAPLSDLAGRKVFAFCGIAAPEGFFAMLADLGARVVGRRALEDHVHYTAALQADLQAAADDTDADMVITTQKDHVKLADTDLGPRTWQLVMELDVIAGGDEILEKIRAVAAG